MSLLRILFSLSFEKVYKSYIPFFKKDKFVNRLYTECTSVRTCLINVVCSVRRFVDAKIHYANNFFAWMKTGHSDLYRFQA